MSNFIVLLRGINVSGRKKIKMADLRNVLEQKGFMEVTTYIQSGNIVLRSTDRNPDKISERVQQAIQDFFGHDVPVLTLPYGDVHEIVGSNPFGTSNEEDHNRLYYVLLHKEPSKERTDSFRKETYSHEQFSIGKRCVYLLCENGYGNAKLNNNLIERKLAVNATTRNHRTMMKLLEMAG